MSQKERIILFDGVCNMCNGAVRFIIKRDRRERFRFAALQSEAGQRLLAAAGVDGVGIDSVVLIEQEAAAPRTRAFVQSTAALRIACGLDGTWPLWYAFIVVPRPLRDLVYRFIARNRYRWFGKRDACMLPTPELRRRFID